MERLFEMPIYQRNEATKSYNRKYIVQLVKNYRSHHDILEVCNEAFYENQLKYETTGGILTIMDDSTLLLNGNCRIIFNSVDGRMEQEGQSFYNENEIKMVMNYVLEIQKMVNINGRNITQTDIGIISPYNAQNFKIRQALCQEGLSTITVGSAEIFQGQQRPIIIVSAVRVGESLGFVANSQRFNVMVTRAESLLIIIGHHESLYKNNVWKKQIDYCISLGSLIQNGRKLYTRIQAPN